MDTSRTILLVPPGKDELAARLLQRFHQYPSEHPGGTLHPAASIDAGQEQAIDAVVLIATTRPELKDAVAFLSARSSPACAVLCLVEPALLEEGQQSPLGNRCIPLTISGALFHAYLTGILTRQDDIARIRKRSDLTYEQGVDPRWSVLQQELEMASTVQKHLLPDDQLRHGNLEASMLWRPLHCLSGDLYQLIPHGHDQLGIVLVDATGHGIPAALLTMTMTQSLDHCLASEDIGMDPSRILQQMNEDLLRRRGSISRYATAICAVVNAHSGTVRLASAGHPPCLLLQRSMQCTPVESDGGLLGVFEHDTWETVAFQLDPGDRLVFHSDGLDDAFDRAAGSTPCPPRAGAGRFREILQEADAAPTSEAVVTEITNRVERLVEPPGDDLSLVCVQYGTRDLPIAA